MRRLLVADLVMGAVVLPEDQAHHARDVLRLGVGDEVELFAADGRSAVGKITETTPGRVVVEVAAVRSGRRGFELTIASAIPKGSRADWMIEKLSELGAVLFVPLETARSVVHPEGKNKIERWQRLAAESAKQSHRSGVMRIEQMMRLEAFLEREYGRIVYLSTAVGCSRFATVLEQETCSLAILVGPEGGWSPEEVNRFTEAHLTPITLGGTILRVETAAIAAAAVVAASMPQSSAASSPEPEDT